MQEAWKSKEDFQQWVKTNKCIDVLLTNALTCLEKEKDLRKYYKKLKKILCNPTKTETDDIENEKKKFKILAKISSFFLIRDEDMYKLKDPDITSNKLLNLERKKRKNQEEEYATEKKIKPVEEEKHLIPEFWTSEAEFHDWVIEKGIIDKVLIEALPYLKNDPNPFVELRYNRIKRLQDRSSKSPNMTDKEILLSNTDYLFIKKESNNAYKLKDVVLFQNLLKQSEKKIS